MYQNTGPEAHEMAADLLRNGVDVHAAYTRLYEDQPAGKVELLGRALSTLKRFDDGVLTIVNLTKADFDETESEETWTEGIVDFARAHRGHRGRRDVSPADRRRARAPRKDLPALV